jgi:hypothetical protein
MHTGKMRGARDQNSESRATSSVATDLHHENLSVGIAFFTARDGYIRVSKSIFRERSVVRFCAKQPVRHINII